MGIQLFQDHLLKRLFFFYWIAFIPLPKISLAYLCWSISGFSIIFHLIYVSVLWPIPCCIDCCSNSMSWNQVKYFSHFILVFQYSFSFSSSFAFSYKFENSTDYILEKCILLEIGVLGRWSLPKWFLSW